jgi:hypothetical protein
LNALDLDLISAGQLVAAPIEDLRPRSACTSPCAARDPASISGQ